MLRKGEWPFGCVEAPSGCVKMYLDMWEKERKTSFEYSREVFELVR